jgi:cellulose synthase/poly-beta-1,6-N-acetylglucosamine synthase-like glycosyltransferase
MTVFIGIAITITIYYIGAVVFLYRGLRSIQSPEKALNDLTFSIVIAARNEERNLAACLDACFAQKVPPDRYEVIVVDDRSTDATGTILSRYSAIHPNLTPVTVDKTPDGIAPKKHAVAAGIKRARNEIIVFTDADCLVPPTWLKTIERYFSEETGLVQGITVYVRPEGMNGLFFGLQAVDFLSHGIVAAAAIGCGMPINSNANNFAFRKEAFEEVDGYGDRAGRVVSGDDDLLLQRIARSGRWKVDFMADPAGAVETQPTPTLGGVFNQRKRWGSKTVYYTPGQALFLGGVFLFYLVLFSSLCAGFFFPPIAAVFGAMLIVKVGGELPLMLFGTALFGRKKLRKFILPASLIQLPVVLAAVLFGVFGRFSWKGERFGRKVR